MGQIGYMYQPDTNQWTLYQEGEEQPVEKTPVIKASVESSEFKGSTTVTFSVENAKKATIRINGTTETFTDSITKTFADTTEVTIEAVNETKSAAKSYKYTKIQDEQSDMISIYFTNNQNWNEVYAYTWGGSESTSSWPGDKMTYVGLNEFNEKVYQIEIAPDIKGLIFNNGSSAQTVDITSGITDGLGYYISGGSGSKSSVGAYVYAK